MADTLLRVVSCDPSVEVRITGLEKGLAPGRFLIEVELSESTDTTNHQLSAHAPERKDTTAHANDRRHYGARSARLHAY